MNILLAKIKTRTADFAYNFSQIITFLENNKGVDLIVFPKDTLCSCCCKDLENDEKFSSLQRKYFENLIKFETKIPFIINLAGKFYLIKDKSYEILDGIFDFCGEKIFISDKLEVVDCDIYIYVASNPFSVTTDVDKEVRNFANKISHHVYYLNNIALADENIYVDKIGECEEEQIFNALVFALREYCEINGFKQILTGLSGGIDSALTTTLASFALGKENVKVLLMPSEFSTEHSVKDAQDLVKNLGIKSEIVPIKPLFDCFLKEVSKQDMHDLAVENLQARLRGLTVMFYSNRENYLVLANGNKSEVAMGYATLYGDMVGGFNLICDLTKQRVYKLARWINKKYGNIIPENILLKAPSAELRPNQKDQDSLPEYEILDDIIEMYIEKNVSREVMYKKYGEILVEDTLKKMVKAQYKRKQACLGVKITDRAFCSNVDLPIIQNLY